MSQDGLLISCTLTAGVPRQLVSARWAVSLPMGPGPSASGGQRCKKCGGRVQDVAARTSPKPQTLNPKPHTLYPKPDFATGGQSPRPWLLLFPSRRRSGWGTEKHSGFGNSLLSALTLGGLGFRIMGLGNPPFLLFKWA